MGDTTTLSVNESTLERFNDHKRGTGGEHSEFSADQFINHLLDEWSGHSNDTGGVDADELASEVSRRIDYAELATKTAEELEARVR